MKLLIVTILLPFVIGCPQEQSAGEKVIQKIEALGGFVSKDFDGTIDYINLSSCIIDDALIQELSKLDHLKYLILEESDIDNDDLKQIGKITSLELLNINMTKTTDEGLFHLLKLDNLKTFKMSHYSLTRLLPEKYKEASIDDLLSGKIKVERDYESDYGEGIRALVKKSPELKTILWGALPGPYLEQSQ